MVGWEGTTSNRTMVLKTKCGEERVRVRRWMDSDRFSSAQNIHILHLLSWRWPQEEAGFLVSLFGIPFFLFFWYVHFKSLKIGNNLNTSSELSSLESGKRWHENILPLQLSFQKGSCRKYHENNFAKPRPTSATLHVCGQWQNAKVVTGNAGLSQTGE